MCIHFDKTRSYTMCTCQNPKGTAVEFMNDGGYVCVKGPSRVEDKTYRNQACAKCNGAAATDITSGPCENGSPLFHPCINTECGANAHCTCAK